MFIFDFIREGSAVSQVPQTESIELSRKVVSADKHFWNLETLESFIILGSSQSYRPLDPGNFVRHCLLPLRPRDTRHCTIFYGLTQHTGVLGSPLHV